jgi:hypothetical protein
LSKVHALLRRNKYWLFELYVTTSEHKTALTSKLAHQVYFRAFVRDGNVSVVLNLALFSCLTLNVDLFAIAPGSADGDCAVAV